MATALAEREPSAEELITYVVEQAIERGVPPSEIASEVTHSIDTLHHFARVGLIFAAGVRLHGTRGGPDDVGESESAGGATPNLPAPGRSSRGWFALGAIYHVGADGRLKSLKHFDAADCEHLLTIAESRRHAWAIRKAWAKDAANELTQHGAAFIQDLPIDVFSRLQDKAREAWSR